MTQYLICAWYPTGWQLRVVTPSWDEALAAYRDARDDTTGPVYLCKVILPDGEGRDEMAAAPPVLAPGP